MSFKGGEPLDYNDKQKDGLYVRCVCGLPWSAHYPNPATILGHRYRPMIGKHGQSKNKPIKTYSEAFGRPFDEDGDLHEFKELHTHTIARNVLNRIAAHGAREFPRECCGFILGDKVEDVRPIKNTNQYGYGSYTMDYPQQLAVLKEVEQGKLLKVVYHSHPNMAAFFSSIDRDAATSIERDKPDWPDTVWIVMSIRNSPPQPPFLKKGQGAPKSICLPARIHLADARAYLWNPAITDFSEITLKVVE